MNKYIWLLGCLFACPCIGYAQQASEPVLMKVNGKSVTRAEFEYAYNKNRDVAGTIAKQPVDEYVDLYADYRLKVEAAKEARLDTLTSFRQEFASYRDQQLLRYLVDTAYVDSVARSTYARIKENVKDADLIHVAHIFLKLPQRASDAEQARLKARMDSIYAQLRGGADFAEVAKACSQDFATARNGGELPWVGPGAFLKDFETVAYSLKTGEMSQPFLSTAGFHVVRMLGRKKLEPYEEKKDELVAMLNSRGLKELACENRIRKLMAQSGGACTREDIMNKVLEEQGQADPSLKYLINEYYDGLLLYEISSRMVWDKAASDTAGMEAYFEKHRSDYKWETPRFNGLLIQCESKDVYRDVVRLIKKNKDNWEKKVQETYNSKGVKVRILKGVYKKGENAFVDYRVFKGKAPEPLKMYPYSDVYGKKQKKPFAISDVREQVKNDYQRYRERQWVETLRAKYPVEIDREVLRTVNNH